MTQHKKQSHLATHVQLTEGGNVEHLHARVATRRDFGPVGAESDAAYYTLR